MEMNENLVTEEVTENVEQTTEETPKMYSEEDFNKKLDEVLGKKLARREAKIRREYDRKYGELEEVLRAGTGKDDVGEMTEMFKSHYEKRGIEMPRKATYSEKDITTLASADADDIIRAGYEEVVEEVDRLAKIGVDKMTPRERATFSRLANYRTAEEESRQLAEIGVSRDVYESAEFKEFGKKFAPGTPIKDVYDIYSKTTTPKKEFKTAGSMKQMPQKDSGVKDFYSFEEASKFTQKDFDNNPALFAAVKKSMTKW